MPSESWLAGMLSAYATLLRQRTLVLYVLMLCTSTAAFTVPLMVLGIGHGFLVPPTLAGTASYFHAYFASNLGAVADLLASK